MAHRDLFPEINPYEVSKLKLSDGHVMYWEQSGNPNGEPIVFLHGGPGAGTTSMHRRFFDPTYYRIILFDQRGAGKSTPIGSILSNTTQHLVADMEYLREYLLIEKWFLFGGSWGSTLALAYAQSHVVRCKGLILRGIFLCSPEEVEWFLYGMSRFFPDEWKKFVNEIDESERHDLLSAYKRRLDSTNAEINLSAAKAWAEYEASCSTLRGNEQSYSFLSNNDVMLALARLEAHYLVNNAFLGNGALIKNMEIIKHLPGIIIQGRYDMGCPPITADNLASSWPGAEYKIINDAGHSAFELGTRNALVAATEKMKQIR